MNRRNRKNDKAELKLNDNGPRKKICADLILNRYSFSFVSTIFAPVFKITKFRIGIMIRQCAILFGCLALGELTVWLTGIKLPSSIIGMLLLTLFLKLGWIKLHWVQGMSDFLVANLGFFFVPPGVALMLYFDLIAAEFWPIVTASVVSTLLVIVVTGWVHQLTRKIK